MTHVLARLASIFLNAAVEQTEAGEQFARPFGAPILIRQRLAHLIAQPLTPANPKSLSTSGLGACARPTEAGARTMMTRWKRGRSDEAARNPLSLF